MQEGKYLKSQKLNDFIKGDSDSKLDELRKYFNENYDAKNKYGPPSLNEAGDNLVEEIMKENMKLFIERKNLLNKLENLFKNSEISNISNELERNISKTRRLTILEDISYEKIGDCRGIFQKEGEQQLQEEIVNMKSLIEPICVINNILEIPKLDESFRSFDIDFENEYRREYYKKT
jgi:ABC-type phosphate transport system auxiliary subunit